MDYLRLNATTVEAEMNSQMRENAKIRKTTPTNTTSTATTQQSTATTSTQRSTTRRRIVNKEQVSAKQMQKHDLPIIMSFD